MGVLDRFRTIQDGTAHQVELLRESLADLSLRLEDRGWSRVGTEDAEFSREALTQAAKDGRALAVAHPLVRRGLALRTAYIHGNGGPQVTVEHSNSDVNALVQAWWWMPENQRSVTGPEARARLERSLGTDGNVFIACFTNPVNGMVRHRTVPFDQITKVVTDPDDRMQVRFYERRYTTEQGGTVTVLHPDLQYAPRSRPRTINGVAVEWNAPIRHVKVNDIDGWLFGIGDTFSIAPWARAYRDFLGDWAKLMRSLSQFAWRASADGKRAAKARQALQRAIVTPGNETGAGATYIHGTGETLEAIPKSGATIDADSGRPLLAMIAAGLDVPVTMLSTDPGVTGARATAETLDRPMYLAMKARQDVWTATFADLAGYVIEQAVRAKAGRLQGQIVQDEWMNTDHAELDGEEPTVTVSWPDLSTESTDEMVKAIVAADATRKLPPRLIAHRLLVALGVEDIDTVLDELTGDDGEWRDPYANLGATLTSAFRDGRDPAEALGQYKRFQSDPAVREAVTP